MVLLDDIFIVKSFLGGALYICIIFIFIKSPTELYAWSTSIFSLYYSLAAKRKKLMLKKVDQNT